MNKRAAGISFFVIAALLYATRYLSAAIFGSNVVSWDSDLFRGMLQYVGQGLTTWSLVALGLGVIYLAWGELEGLRSKRDVH